MAERDFSRAEGETGGEWHARLLAMVTTGWSAADCQEHQEAVRRAGWFAQAEAADPVPPRTSPAPLAEGGSVLLRRIQQDCLRLSTEERRQLRDWLDRQH
jgi:hypothetical protein